MASIRYAKKRARKKSREVFRTNKRKPKRAILKKFSNFVGKVTFQVAKRVKRRGRSRRKRY